MAAISLTSPLERSWTQLGARLTEVGEGWRMPASFAGAESELRAARQGVSLGDGTPRGRILVQGEAAAAIIGEAAGGVPEKIGEVTGTAAMEIARLRPDLFHVGTSAEGRAGTLTSLRDAKTDALSTITDVTHGRFEMRLVGPAAPVLLSKLCGLDFDSAAFPSGAARQTSVAKTRQLVIRSDLADLPAYRLLGSRSLGAYVWDTLMAAGRDLGVEPIGVEALQALGERGS